MLKKSLVLAAIFLTMAAFAHGDNLYRVMVNSQFEAELIESAEIEALAPIQGGYLVLTSQETAQRLATAELEIQLIETGIEKDQIALDLRRDRANSEKYPLIFEEGDLRLYRTEEDLTKLPIDQITVMPIRNDFVKVEYVAPRDTELTGIDREIGMDLLTLIDMISQDSLESYSYRLQAFNGRLTGTDSNYASRDWIADKFVEFGYDSVAIDSFVANISGYPTECQNVIAYKIGSVLPDHHVIIGAHRDAVLNSPGADDNGSGTCGVLEIARIMKDIETDLTFIFILFDAEEQGLNGAYHYCEEASARGDSIVYMLNMDMIAHYENTSTANLFHGTKLGYTELWQHLADSLLGVNGILAGGSSGSDHYPYLQYGYEATFVAEYIFSSVYHSPQDSTSYMDFEYMTKLVKASIATVYSVSETYIPGPMLKFAYPGGTPIFVTAGSATTFDVDITGYYDGILVPGTPTVYYSIDGGPYTADAMTPITSERFRATLPPADCGSRYTFYVGAEEDSMGIYYDPDPSSPKGALVASSETLTFSDNFETDLGWTVSGNASDGQWDRGVPVGGGDRGDPPTDYDGSGSCYLTDNLDDNTDVDGGVTYLDSPVFDLSNREGRISYACWYSNSFGASPYLDVMKIYVSNNGGGNWVLAQTIGPVDNASGGWYEYSFWVSQFVNPTDQMKVRFEASDIGDGSVVEAGVDAFAVHAYMCGAGEPPSITTTALPGGTIGVLYSQQLEAIGGFGSMTWSDEMNNLDGTGFALSSYGLLSGTPMTTNPVLFTAKVSDELGSSDEQFYMIQISGAYECGDANGDGDINVADGVFVINYVFKGGPPPNPVEAGDANCDDETNVADAVYLINYVFKGGPAPCCP